jgi:hypothetical protein
MNSKSIIHLHSLTISNVEVNGFDSVIDFSNNGADLRLTSCLFVNVTGGGEGGVLRVCVMCDV